MNIALRSLFVCVAASAIAACSGPSAMRSAPVAREADATRAVAATTALPPQLHVPPGFGATIVATVAGARELAALPNGDLIVGRTGTSVVLVPNADTTGPSGTPVTFASFPEPAEGVAFGSGFVFVGTEHAVWRIPYTTGVHSGTPQQIAAIRQGQIPPNSDGDVHHSTSVAVRGSLLAVGIGSSCNACVEIDPTRATVQRMNLDGTGMTTQAHRFRNAIALATDPATQLVWAGGAGQDNLPHGHPYEFIDAVSVRTPPADYGWPACEENHVAYIAGSNCANVVVPAIEFPAYSTLIGAAVYPASQTGAHAFPAAWRHGMYVTLHGSWHSTNGVPDAPPHVAFVPFAANGAPLHPVNWSDPTAQWTDFFTGFQDASGHRIGRPTGIAISPSGALFVADGQTGSIYRIIPTH